MFTYSSFALLTIAWQFLFYLGESKVRDIAATVNRQIRSLGFPEGSGMGIFFAIGIPVDIPDQSVTFSFYFEANYLLPNNENFIDAEFDSNFRGRSFNRSVAYNIIERKLEGAGYPGRPCLLRSICEAATSPVTYNGVIGDIIHLILTPSSSENEGLPADLAEAEHAKDCINNYNECPISLLNFISSYRQ